MADVETDERRARGRAAGVVAVVCVIALAATLTFLLLRPLLHGATDGPGWSLLGRSPVAVLGAQLPSPAVLIVDSAAALEAVVDGGPIGMDFALDRVLVFVMGASGSCPPLLASVDLAEGRIVVRDTRGPYLSCSADLSPYTFLLRVDRAAVGEGPLQIRLESTELGPFEVVADVAP